jgi:hypothetical protein
MADAHAEQPVQRVIITGGSRGLGFALVKEFLDAGYEVTTTCTNYRDWKGLNDLREYAHSKGGQPPRLYVRQLDYANPDSVERFASGLRKRAVVYDAIIHNGAIGGTRHVIRDGTPDQIVADKNKVMMTNCEGPLSLSESLMDHVRVHVGITSSAIMQQNWKWGDQLGIQHYREAKIEFADGFSEFAWHAKMNAEGDPLAFHNSFMQVSPGGKLGIEYNAAVQTEMTGGRGVPVKPSAENIFSIVDDEINCVGLRNGRRIGHSRDEMITGGDTLDRTYCFNPIPVLMPV